MIAVVDYKAGNLTSVRLAFDAIGTSVTITDSPDVVMKADRVVFPGVGAAGASMQNLHNLGLADVIRAVVRRGTPFLGICIGCQVALEHSDEDGGVDCLGLLPGTVRRFRPTDRFDKVPQMGWNTVRQMRPHPMFENIPDNTAFYFVHSYYPDPANIDCVLGSTDYAGASFASAIAHKNLVATQFHPEKSGRFGLKLLDNFIRWTPGIG
jgi:glutamine amidotransferase